MKKEDILKKAQEEGADEMENFVRDKSMSVMFIVMGICIAVFMWIRQDLNERYCDLPFTVALGASAGNFYRFAKVRKAKNLCIAIVTGICAVFYLILTVLGY